MGYDVSAGNDCARRISDFTCYGAIDALAKGHWDARNHGDRTSEDKPQESGFHLGLILFVASDSFVFSAAVVGMDSTPSWSSRLNYCSGISGIRRTACVD
jgi:hypothetical protein